MTEQEFQAALAQRDEQIRALSGKLGAHERIVKELGDSVERDAYGNPVRLVVEQTTPPGARSPGGTAPPYGHPFAPFQSLAPEGWTTQQVDDYFSKLLGQQGYLTQAQYQQREAMIQQSANTYTTNSLKLYDHIQRTQTQYPWLSKPEDPAYKKTIEILRSQGYAVPQGDAKTWLDYSWNDIEGLGKAARMADTEIFREQQAAANAQASGQGAQGAAQLAAGGAGGAGPGAAPISKVHELIGQQASMDAVAGALDQAVGAT